MTLPAWLTLRPRLLYGVFTGLAFIVALRLTFPSEAVRERLIYEAGGLGWQIDMASVGPTGLLGVRMEGVTLTDSVGLKIPIDRLAASLRTLPLLVGKRVLSFDAEVFDGAVSGRADLSGAERRVRVELEGVNLKAVLPLRKAAGMDFTGLVTGQVDVTLPDDDFSKASGTVDLSVTQAGISGGNVIIPPFTTPLDVPPISFGTLTAAGKADKGRVTMDRLEMRGGDAEVSGEGVAVVLQQRMAYTTLSGKLRLRITPALWQEPAAAPRKPIVEAALMNARAPDGSYLYQLYGNLSTPQLRPASAGGAPPPTPGNE